VKHQLMVAASEPGTRLDVFLSNQLNTTRSQAQRWLKAQCVWVNGLPARANYIVAPQDQVVVELAEVVTARPAAPDLPIVYEDADMLVIDKPAGIAVHAGNGHGAVATVADFARLRTTDPDAERPGIVHRLDRETSGLLVIAKTEAAKRSLQDQWRSRAVKKVYQLLAIGRVRPDEAVIDLPLDRDPAHPTRRHVSQGGRSAATRYKSLASYPGYSYIEAYPETGRTHQLRVHFAALGHPIAGDIVYGPPIRPLGLKRHFLHATELTLTSPSGQLLHLQSLLPPELKTILTSLE